MYQLNLSKSIASTCIACAFLAAPISALAQAKVPDTNYGIGLGVIPSDEGYKGIGLKTTLIPAVRIQTPRFSLRGTSAEFIVTNPENQAWDSFGLRRVWTPQATAKVCALKWVLAGASALTAPLANGPFHLI